jgi:hypothetical protein
MRRGRRHGPTRSDRRGLKVVVLVLGSKSSSKAAKVLYWLSLPLPYLGRLSTHRGRVGGIREDEGAGRQRKGCEYVLFYLFTL